MAAMVAAQEAAEIAVRSIGRGYDILDDLRLEHCKCKFINSRLIEIDEDSRRELVLPGGNSVPNVSNSIKCYKGESTTLTSEVLSFEKVYLSSSYNPCGT